MKRVLLLASVLGMLPPGTAPLGARENAAEHARALALAAKLMAPVSTLQTEEGPAVHTLDFAGTAVADRDLYILGGLTRLRDLFLDDTKVTNAGLVHLANLKQLNLLDLAKTNVSDAGLVHLKPLTGLTSLFLDHTHVSDAGLVHLQEMKQLKTLDLTGSKCTKKGVAELRKALPNATISD